MVEGVLDLTAVEAGKLQLDRRPTDLVELTGQSLKLCHYVATRKQIRIQFEPEADVPLLLLDEARFAQVVDNLVSNAVKYSRTGGRVMVRIACEPRRAAEQVVLSVCDRGLGISPDELDGLFTPFGRTSTRPVGGGTSTGLGLAIVHKIVTAHGGELRVESTPGAGSTFSVVLPVIRANHPG
jgi:signal transduction histidine kinase